MRRLLLFRDLLRCFFPEVRRNCRVGKGIAGLLRFGHAVTLRGECSFRVVRLGLRAFADLHPGRAARVNCPDRPMMLRGGFMRRQSDHRNGLRRHEQEGFHDAAGLEPPGQPSRCDAPPFGKAGTPRAASPEQGALKAIERSRRLFRPSVASSAPPGRHAASPATTCRHATRPGAGHDRPQTRGAPRQLARAPSPKRLPPPASGHASAPARTTRTGGRALRGAAGPQ